MDRVRFGRKDQQQKHYAQGETVEYVALPGRFLSFSVITLSGRPSLFVSIYHGVNQVSALKRRSAEPEAAKRST